MGLKYCNFGIRASVYEWDSGANIQFAMQWDAGRSLEFEASLVYTVNSRTAKGYTEKPYLTLGLILRRETPQREKYVNVLPKSI